MRMRWAEAHIVLVGVLTMSAFLTAPAFAQPITGRAALDEGEAAYAEADFESARAHLANAVEGELERADIVRLFTARAFLSFALGEFDALEHDLLAILTLQPLHVLGVRAPPPLLEVFSRLQAQVQDALSVHVELEAFEAGVRLRARVRGDAAGIVESVRVSARGAGGEWMQAEGNVLVLPLLSGREVQLHAEVIGPGGAVLTHEGSEGSPRTEVIPRVVTANPPPATGLTSSAKVGIVVGAAVVVSALALVLYFALSASSETQPQGPFLPE